MAFILAKSPDFTGLFVLFGVVGVFLLFGHALVSSALTDYYKREPFGAHGSGGRVFLTIFGTPLGSVSLFVALKIFDAWCWEIIPLGILFSVVSWYFLLVIAFDPRFQERAKHVRPTLVFGVSIVVLQACLGIVVYAALTLI